MEKMDLLLVVDSEETVIGLNPNHILMKELDGLCVAVTAKGKAILFGISEILT